MTDQHTPPPWLAALFSYVAAGSRRRRTSEAHADAPQRGRRRHPGGKRARRRGDPVIEYTNRSGAPVELSPPEQVVQHLDDDDLPGARAQLAERAERLREQTAHRPYVSTPEAGIVDTAPPLPPAELAPAEQRVSNLMCSDMPTSTLPSNIAPISAPPVPPEAPAPAAVDDTREDTDQ